MSYMNLFCTNRFETILADTEHSRGLHFCFRYKVFCEETGFEQASSFPDEKEKDGYDAFAVHFIVWDRLHKRVAGAMRLIDAYQTDLPIEHITERRVTVPSTARRHSIEFSRLCIDRRYIRLAQGVSLGYLESTENKDRKKDAVLFRQEPNEILVRLIRAFITWCETYGKTLCYFLATKALARVLQRESVRFSTIGSSVNHRGARFPYLGHVSEMHEGMQADNSVYRWLLETCPSVLRASMMLPLPAERKIDSDASELDYSEGARPAQRLWDRMPPEYQQASAKMSRYL